MSSRSRGISPPTTCCIDRFVELEDLRRELAPFYSNIGRTSIDPELMIRMLLIGYIASAYDRSGASAMKFTSVWRIAGFALSPIIRRSRRTGTAASARAISSVACSRPSCVCIRERLVGGEGFAVDASLIKADANRQKGIDGNKWIPPEAAGRAIDECLAVLDDAAFGAATEVTPKFVSPSDPAARWTGAHGGQAYFAYSTNYLVDVENAINVDVEATTAIRQAEVLAAKRMIQRSLERFDLYPSRLLGDSAYGSAAMLGWLVSGPRTFCVRTRLFAPTVSLQMYGCPA
jgi:hypothetical protein